MAIYEMAFAQLRGGYKGIDGGWGDEGLNALTGQSSERLDAGDLSLTDLKNKLDQGYAVTTGSKDNKTLWFFGGSDSTDNHQVVTTHEYVVEHVDTDAHPPTVTLLNPWGKDGVDDANVKVPQEITLTEDQWHEYFREVGTTKGKV
ncbi:C2 family cysteine protease [Streptomyces sp. NPDC001709]